MALVFYIPSQRIVRCTLTEATEATIQVSLANVQTEIRYEAEEIQEAQSPGIQEQVVESTEGSEEQTEEYIETYSPINLGTDEAYQKYVWALEDGDYNNRYLDEGTRSVFNNE